MATTSRKKAPTPTDASPEVITATRTAKCRTLGNGSQLTYQVGTDADDLPHIRMVGAAGGGFFSSEWVSLQSVLDTLDAWPAGFCSYSEVSESQHPATTS